MNWATLMRLMELWTELEQQLKSLQIEHENVEKSAVVQVPLMKHSLSLYANITKIKWDFSSENIAGSMVNTDTGMDLLSTLPVQYSLLSRLRR